MGVCLSCLGLGRHSHHESDRTRLLYDDYPAGHSYGTWGSSNVPPQNLMSPEEVQREQEALDGIARWASDQIIEIFPHNHRSLVMSATSLQQLNGVGVNNRNHSNGVGVNGDQRNNATTTNNNPSSSSQQHQDILLSLIPGDKSKRSIRIYPASRPTSKSGLSLRSKSSVGTGMNGTNSGKHGGDSVLVTLDVNLP
ncbi:uncharacterized protein Z520_04095 [Fonsecaea multimorphosa CBS 102226]|uniref:Uncharacterized protein n=1 Tax=Fonsecaea multimorphosa CBS 102226 TaxID=1442371 RepID=A0A0D2KBC5_9EURO|nr:uncharacterized protein Z520_04095 [Fonsecaea multimorphosa CBS 102226]KIY00410.1 hypothetical protein Z520_04095 [Fonsecaea multimorphosa CBS 102226]OAL26925.1 hypothetical protein AYO22_03869 [Fonsecaea multimorphosa]